MKTLRIILSVLTRRERVTAIALAGLMIVSMFLEIVGIGIVVPALAAMSSGMQAFSSPRAKSWLEYFGNPTQSQIILWGLALLLAVYAIKAVALIYTNWRQGAFVMRLQSRAANQLFQNYLMQPWSYHLGRNSGDLVRNLTETQTLGNGCNALLSLIAESLVMIGILGLLVWNEPLGAIAVAAITGFAAWLLHFVTRRRLLQWGTDIGTMQG